MRFFGLLTAACLLAVSACNTGYVGFPDQWPVALSLATLGGGKDFAISVGDTVVLRATITTNTGVQWVEDGLLVSRDSGVVQTTPVSRIVGSSRGSAYVVASNLSLRDSVHVVVR
jgi:hypothetical protein